MTDADHVWEFFVEPDNDDDPGELLPHIRTAPAHAHVHSFYGCNPPCPQATDPPAPVRVRAALWAMRARLAWTLPGRCRRAQVAARTTKFALSYLTIVAAVCVPAALAEVESPLLVLAIAVTWLTWLVLRLSPLRPGSAAD